MFTIFGRSVSCLVTPKLVGLVRDTGANNINLISSTRENTFILSANSNYRGILVRTMADSSNETRPKSQNRLALEKSPYLLQHAHNPVDWYPWGEEAFAKARREDRLLFLSVGYATCHWCHVMEHECFENEAVAVLMNRNFVNVKVDREERPDVDRLYMTFVQATSGGGGWPMSVWLTPDLLPVFGGTYFPPEDDVSGRPGFKTLLGVIEKQWRENRAKMAASGARVAAALSRVASRSADDDEASTASGGAGASRRRSSGPEYAEQCFKALEAAFDARHGGFGRAPKFPQAPVLEFLLTEWARAPTRPNGKMALQMVTKTLKHLALGGVRDHVGEGFARYSVDGEWRVPHFEKMLYDQAQLSAVYASVYLATKDPLFASACRGAIEYTERALGHPEGGFCSAEDADSIPPYNLSAEPLEGAFYVWTEEEVRDALRSPGAEWQMQGEEPLADLFCRRFCISAEGNVAPGLDPHGHLTGRNVLRLKAAPGQDSSGDDAREGERLKHALRLLRVVRDARPRPRKDHKIITAWNGLMITALSRAGEALGDEALVQRAVKAAAFARSHLFAEGRLLRVVYAPDSPGTATPGDIIRGSSPIWGFLSDYTFLIRGLLDLYEASLDPEWLSWAEQLQETQNELFWDEEGHGFFTTTLGDTSILFRSKEEEDGAEPASGGVATLNLLRLGTLTGREEHCARADKCLRAASHLLRAAPHAAPTLCAAARAKWDGALGVVVSAMAEDGAPRDKGEVAVIDREASALLAIVRSRLLPWRALALADTRLAACEALAPARREQVRQMAQQPGAAFVCRRRACSLPVRDGDALAQLLEAHIE